MPSSSAATHFVSRAVQLATLTARYGMPATYSLRSYVAAGGLMSYGTRTSGTLFVKSRDGLYTRQRS